MSEIDPENYTPSYVDLDDIPVTGPDNYSSGDKRRALYSAEGTLEVDLNQGEQIKPDDVTRAHRIAVGYLGTHHLTQGAVSPNDTTLGDMSDSGSQRESYSSHFKQEYEDMIERILDAEAGGRGGDSSNHSVSVNTRDSTVNDKVYPQRRDWRFTDN